MYLHDYLYYLTGEPVHTFKNGQREVQDNAYYLYLNSTPIINIEEIQPRLCKANSVLILCNQERHALFYQAGVVSLTEEYIATVLKDWVSGADYSIASELGGCTQKEILDILKLAQAEHGGIDKDSIKSARRSYIQPRRGLELVDTDIPGYVPETKLFRYIQEEQEYFFADIDSRLRPRGILVHGDNGTGKTAGAKYLSKSWGVPLFRLNTDIQSKWLGESELFMKQALDQLDTVAPACLLLDEVEKFFARTQDSGVTEKMLGSLLWWLQEHKSRVFVYMTCNNLDVLPPELYREGRIDDVFRFERLSITKKDKLAAVVTALTRTYKLTKQKRIKVVEQVLECIREYEDCTISHAEINELVKVHVREMLPLKT